MLRRTKVFNHCCGRVSCCPRARRRVANNRNGWALPRPERAPSTLTSPCPCLRMCSGHATGTPSRSCSSPCSASASRAGRPRLGHRRRCGACRRPANRLLVVGLPALAQRPCLNVCQLSASSAFPTSPKLVSRPCLRYSSRSGRWTSSSRLLCSASTSRSYVIVMALSPLQLAL
jgi:hypothetical protein